MRGIVIIGMMFALLLATVPANAMDWSKMTPSETQEVDLGGTSAAGTILPTTLDCSSVAKLCASDTQKVDVGGAAIAASALQFKLDCSSVETLCPSETQKVEE